MRRWLPAGVAAAGAVGLMASPAGRRATRRAAMMLSRKTRYLRGRARGLAYHLRGRHPSAEVPDVVLAQRIRSTLGPVQKRLDIPHVHVVVCDHIASLHGVVDRSEDAHTIQQTVLHVPGVNEVISHLHVGLRPGDTRPSAGRR
jgi:osmotically-inducible protein OsmY